MADWLYDCQESCRDLYRDPTNSARAEPANLQTAARLRFAELVSILLNLRESENQRLESLMHQVKKCAQLSKSMVLPVAGTVFEASQASAVAAPVFWESVVQSAMNNVPLLLDFLFARFKVCLHPVTGKKLRDDKFCFASEKPPHSITADQFIGPFPDLLQVSGLKEYSQLGLQKAQRLHRSLSSPASKPLGMQPELRVIDEWLVSIRHVYEQIRSVFCESFHFVRACAMKVALEVLSQSGSQAYVAPLDSLKRYFKENVR